MFKKRLTMVAATALIISGSQQKVAEAIKKENFKRESDFVQLSKIQKRLLDVLILAESYCRQRNQQFLITQLISTAIEDSTLMRVSDTHLEGRAADIRVLNWTKTFTLEFVNFLNNSEFAKFGAVSLKDGKRRLAVYEDETMGRTPHVHIQVSK